MHGLLLSVAQKYIRSGAFAFTYGSSDSLVDFVHIDNVVQVHILAADALTADKSYIAVSFSSKYGRAFHFVSTVHHKVNDNSKNFPRFTPIAMQQKLEFCIRIDQKLFCIGGMPEIFVTN